MLASDHRRALRCLALLAQCGQGDDDANQGARDIEPLALDVIDLTSCINNNNQDQENEAVPTRGLVNLLAALFVEQRPPTATATATATTTTTTRITYSDETVASLLILLVRGIEQQLTDGDNEEDEEMRDEDEVTMRQQRPQQEEEESKVRQVLLALGNRLISAQVVLGEHVEYWRRYEAVLRRFLPADCEMLIAMLPPSS
jgi:sensor c-di-GMP phosphodiesterase-like protein